jgi:hypothetical protein
MQARAAETRAAIAGWSRKLGSFAVVLLSLAISAEAFAFVLLHYVVRIDWSCYYLTSEGQPAALVGLTEDADGSSGGGTFW